MRRFLLVLALVIAGLLVLNGCVAETPEQPESQPEDQVETPEASTIYEAVSVLFDQPVETSYTATVKGVVVEAYNNVVLIQDADGRAGLRVELAEGESLPEIGRVLKVQGNLRKYERPDENITTFKIEDATYDILNEEYELIFSDLTDEYFESENNYKMNSLVHATGTVTYVKTGDYPKIYLETEVGDATKEVAVFSFDSDVKDWINDQGDSLVGSTIYVRGYWSKYKDDWEIIPRDPSDIPAMGE